MGKSGKQTIGYKYYMTMVMGLCRGPVDEIVRIEADDKLAYPLGTQTTITDNTETEIDAENLFGGETKEGGLKGRLAPLMGIATQLLPAWLTQIKNNDVPENVPANRGVVTMAYDGLICAMSPYPKPWKVRVRRSKKGWDGDVWQPDLAKLSLAADLVKAMNGAHILYECATNRDWGRGLSRDFIDEDAWLVAAQALYDEGLGLCLRWNRQDDLKDFIGQVLSHIGGAIGVDRRTGLLTIKLFRKDYDSDTIPSFDSNSGLIKVTPSNESQDLALNEVIVTYNDPTTKKRQGQVRVQDLASIQSNGGSIRSTTTEYLGVPTATLALRLAQRDLQMSVAGTKKYSVELDHRAWNIAPGSVFKIAAPEEGIESVILRAGKVDFAEDGPIKVEATLDVFGLEDTAYVADQTGTWVPPDRAAHVVANRVVREANWRDLVRVLSPVDLAAVPDDVGTIGVAALQPIGGLDTNFDIYSKVTTSPRRYSKNGDGDWCPAAILSANIGPYDTTIHYSTIYDFDQIDMEDVENGGIALEIGGEILRVDAIDDAAKTMTVGRGCVDTQPAAHLSGILAYFTDVSAAIEDVQYSETESVSVKLLSNSAEEQLPLATAPEDLIDINARQNCPFLPGNIKINGTLAHNVSTVSGDIAVTWAHRNRLTQADNLIDHTVSTITPEPGTTYTIKVYHSAVLLRTTTGIATEAWTYDERKSFDDGDPTTITLTLETVRDGRSSFNIFSVDLAHTIVHTAPAAPGNITGPVSSGIVHLASTAPSSAIYAGTQFWKNTSATFGTAAHLGSVVAGSPSASITKDDTPGVGVYWYWATAIGYTGQESAATGPVKVTVPGVLGTDSFTVANGALETVDANWTRIGGAAGAATVASNVLAASSATTTLYVVADTRSFVHYAQCNTKFTASLASFPLVVRAVDQQNFIGARWTTTGGGEWELFRFFGGTTFSIGSYAASLPAVDTLATLSVDAADKLTLIVGGVTIAAGVASGASGVLSSATKVGVVIRANSGALLDNFTWGI